MFQTVGRSMRTDDQQYLSTVLTVGPK